MMSATAADVFAAADEAEPEPFFRGIRGSGFMAKGAICSSIACTLWEEYTGDGRFRFCATITWLCLEGLWPLISHCL